jgi:very-short-patch-repair endonuclease
MSRALFERARSFRREPTKSEALMWAALRRNALGVNFRRQHVIGPFVADFACVARRLVVEVDGPVHDTQRERDAERQAFIEAQGYSFFRVTAGEVGQELEAVLTRLRDRRAAQSPPRRE